MRLFGSRAGTLLWVLIGVGTAGLALVNENRVTALIAAGWITLAVFSLLEYRSAD